MRARRLAGLVVLLTAFFGIAWLLLPSLRSEPWPEPPRPVAGTHLDPVLGERIDTTLGELAADPGRVQLRARLGMVYEANELYILAAATYEQLIERVELGGELRYRLARSLERAGRLDDAITSLQGAVRHIDEPGLQHDLLVDWLLQAGRVEEADAVVRSAVEAAAEGTNTSDILPLSRARVLTAQGQIDDAEAFLTGSDLTTGERARPALFLLAQVQRLRGEVEAAQRTTERAAAADPAPTHAWDRGMASHRVGTYSLRQRARVQLEQGDTQGALLTLQTLRDQPGGDDPRVASLMAQAYLQGGRADVAIELLERTAKSHPDNFSTRLNLTKSILLGASLGTAGADLDRALSASDEALALRPDSADAWSTRGQVLDAAGRSDEALAAYEESWRRDERDPTARIRAAWIHLGQGGWAPARDLLLPVTKTRGAAPSALLGRARAEAELGDLETAATLLSWIGERLPVDQLEPVRSRLAELGSAAE